MRYFGAYRAEGQQATDKYYSRDSKRRRLRGSQCAKEWNRAE